MPAERPISVRDLLTMCMGFGAVMTPPDTLPIQRAMAEADLAPGPRGPPMERTTDEWIASLGTLPLMAQPGHGLARPDIAGQAAGGPITGSAHRTGATPGGAPHD